MNDTLDLPRITPEALAPAPAAAKTGAIAESITNVQGEVAKFDTIAAGLRAIEDAHPKNVIVAAIDTTAGMKLAETAWRAYRNPRLEVERARKAAKAPVLALGKAIDTFAGDLETRLRAGEDHYKAQIDAENERKERERIAAAQREEDRQRAHMEFIANIRTFGTHCQKPDMTAARIEAGIAALEAVAVGPEREEFEAEAKAVHAETLAAMRLLHQQAASREAEAARLEAQRIENERQAAELAEARRQIEAQAAEVRRQQQALEDAQRRQREAEELAAQRAESERLEALAVERRAALAAAPAVTAAAFAAVEPNSVTLPDCTESAAEPPAVVVGPALRFDPEGYGAVAIDANPTPQCTPDPLAADELDPYPAFVAKVMEAFSSRFPTQPNMSPAWWAEVRAMGEALQAVEQA